MACFTRARDWKGTWARLDCAWRRATRCISPMGRITICGWRLDRLSGSERKPEGFGEEEARCRLARFFFWGIESGAEQSSKTASLLSLENEFWLRSFAHPYRMRSG